MTMKGNNPASLPYDFKSMDSAGKYKGIGIPAQVALKKGGYTDTPITKKKMPRNSPPRLMN